MKTLIQLALVAIVVGGISAAVTIFTQKPAAPTVAGADGQAPAASASGDAKPSDADKHSEPKSEEQGSPDPQSGDGDEKKADPVDENPLAAAEPPRTHPPKSSKAPENDHAAPAPAAEPVPEARVAVRPPYTPEGDEAGALINLLRERTRAATEAERRLAERQDAMQLIFEDLRSEQALTARIRQKLTNEFKLSRLAVETAQQSLTDERAQLQKQQDETRRLAEEAIRAANEERDRLKKQLEKPASPDAATEGGTTGSTAGTPDENANLKKMATVFDSMTPENAAKVFEQLVKNKKTDAVVALMNAMADRKVGKVLGLISESNPGLAADLTDRLKRLRAGAVKPAQE